MKSIKAIRTNNGKTVFRNLWGDRMHDQINCSPVALATGINWDTVAGDGQPIGDDDEMRRGDKGFQVAIAQKRLVGLGYDLGAFTPYGGPIPIWWTEGALGPGEDGDFGGTMESAVKAYQGALGEAVTGVFTGVAAATLGMSGSTQGDKGDKGDKGDVGSRGPQGDPGSKGDRGVQGVPGRDGKSATLTITGDQVLP